MQPLPTEEKHPFPSPKRTNEGPFLMRALKKENSPIKETFHNLSSSFDPPVKRSLTDSEHDMAPYHLKRFKQTGEDLASLENGGSISPSNKASLQQIVSEVACSLERNNSVPSASFRRKKTFACGASNATLRSVGIMDLKRQENVFESSPRVAVNAAQENLDALPSSANGQGEKISKPKVKAALPVFRTLNCRSSSTNKGVAIDHEFFPKLVGVHSIQTSSAFSPEKGANTHFDHDYGSPLPNELLQKETADDWNFGTLNYDSETEGDIVSPVSPKAFPLPRSNQSLSSDESMVRRDSKCHTQDRLRALPIIPLVLTTSISPDVSTSPLMDANHSSRREKATLPRKTSKSVAEIPTAKSLLSSSQENRNASLLAQTRHYSRKREIAKNTETSSAPSLVSSTLMYSNKKLNPRESPTNIKSVNKQEAVDIHRVAASSPPRKRHCRSSSPSRKPYDLLFNFKKPNGRSDLFLVVKDKVYAVEHFDHEGKSYLIHTNHKGKRAILAKLPEAERLKLQINDRGAIRHEQQTDQPATLQHPAKTSLSVAALQDSLYHGDATDTVSSISSRQLDSDTIYRVMREEDMQERAKSLNENGAILSRGALVRNNGRMKSHCHPSTMSLQNKRLLLKQVLNGIRKEISNHKDTVFVGKHSLPQESTDTLANDRGIYVFSTTHSTPRCASTLSGRERNLQSIVNPNNLDRYQEFDALYHQQQYLNTEVESSARKIHAVGTGQQNFLENQTAKEATNERFALGNTMPPGTLHRSDSINFIAHRYDSNEHALSTSGSVNKPSEDTKQIFSLSKTSANDVINVAKTGASGRMYIYEKSPRNRQFRQLSKLYLGDSHGKCSTSAAPPAGNRAVESSRVAQASTPSEPVPVLLRIPNEVPDHNAKFFRKRPSPDTIIQQRAVLADTCHSLRQECYNSKTIQQLLNGRNEASRMHSNQTRQGENGLFQSCVAASTDFPQSRECPCYNTITAGEKNVLVHTVSEGATRKTQQPLEWQPRRAHISFQQRYLEDALNRGITDVADSWEVATPLDAERNTAGDNVWEGMELRGNYQKTCVSNGAVPESPMGMSKPYNCNGDNFEKTEDPIQKNSQNDLKLREQLEKESPTTSRQTVKERGKSKKKHSCRPESKVERNLSHVPGTADVIVIEDD